MRRSRIALTLFAVPVALVVAGAVLLYGLVRLSWFERRAGEWMSAQLDTRVTVGSLALGYLPTPSLDVGRLAIAVDAGTQSPPLLELGRARTTLPWRTLFGGDPRITRLELSAPTLRLAVDAAGRGNWESLVERLASLGGAGPAAWSVGALLVADGAVEYADARDGIRLELTGITLSAAGIAPGTHFPFELRFAGHGPDIVMHASLAGDAMTDPDRDRYAARGLDYRGWLGGLGLGTGGVELAGTLENLQADLAAGTVALAGLRFDGLGLRLAGRADVSEIDGVPRVAFAVSTEPFAPRALANSLNRPLPETADPAALARVVATMEGRYQAGRLELERIEGGFDDTRVTGSAIVPAEGPWQARLEFDRLDLDRYLPPEVEAAGAPQATLESLLSEVAALDLVADLRFGEARSSGVVARGLRVRIDPAAADVTP